MRALVGSAIFSSRAKWRSSYECMPSCARKVLDTADIVREVDLFEGWSNELMDVVASMDEASWNRVAQFSSRSISLVYPLRCHPSPRPAFSIPATNGWNRTRHLRTFGRQQNRVTGQVSAQFTNVPQLAKYAQHSW